MKMRGKSRPDLVGTNGTVSRKIEIIEAKEYEHGVYAMVSDEKGQEYWVALEDIETEE
jgi:hypothetical protein